MDLEKEPQICACFQGYIFIYPFFNKPPHKALPSSWQAHQMFFSKRVDYVISSAEEMNYYKTIGDIKERYESLNSDGVGKARTSRFRYKDENGKMSFQASYSYVSCPNTDWGKKIINEINYFLREERKSSRYKEAVLYWLPDDLKKMGEKAYEDFAKSEVPIGTINY